MPVLQTTRLYLRELTRADAESFYLLNADPDVMRFTGDAPFATVEEARRFLENYSHYKEYGFGRWGVIRKEDNVFLGWCGLKYSPESNEYDIGFRFFKQYWNKGYATEAAKACMDYGFHRLNIPFIVGRAMAANTASVKVLEKIGLLFERKFEVDGNEWVIFRIRNFAL